MTFAPRIDAVMIGGQLLNIQRAAFTASSNGDNEIVAAVAGKKTIVFSYTLMANGTVNAKFRSDTTDISGLKYFIANTGIACTDNAKGWFETQAGHALNLNLSGAVAVAGELVYAQY
jgi:hypothetical protein